MTERQHVSFFFFFYTQKRVSTPTIKTSESMEGIADTLSNSADSAKTFQQVVSVWKDKDRLSTASSPRGRPRSVQLATPSDSSDSSDNDSSARRDRGSSGSKIDPRAKRRNAIEDSVSDWFGGENWKEDKKDKKKEKKEEKKLSERYGEEARARNRKKAEADATS